ncbi:tRNA pseudouridine synthase B [Ophiobolus disseminans]|uniref:tRNA pseudouridine(55) synthase n=1 Tax=Ophiobolus disseminans TaxID=1469910 RepID=A0A6A6ZSP2_9PLEO|nr:tRNA pseudouridine synthase B [Ophiobolus disseminans]
MATVDETVLEGIFAVAKPACTSSGDVLLKLQATFASSSTFAPLLRAQPERARQTDERVFKMGHGGTLDPLASSILIVGIGRGTKHLQKYLTCTKTYQTVVVFGASTDTYDCTGTIDERAGHQHVTEELVEQHLAQFRGKINQMPPIYSALKINGVKACDYAREGKELPRALESREMDVEDCTLLEWYPGGRHEFNILNDDSLSQAPAARLRLTVSSGFYVRSFAHDLGRACASRSHMASLTRTRQANYAIDGATGSSDLFSAITYADLDAGEDVWGAKLRPQLEAWVAANPTAIGHVNGRDRDVRRKLEEEKKLRPKQRFRGGWVADTKQGRIKQQGGKGKGSEKPDANNTTPIEPSGHATANQHVEGL